MGREVSRIDSVQAGADAEFERFWVVLQKWVWAVMALFVAAGLAGVFGRGPLSKAKAGSQSRPVSVEYERFARYKTPSRLKVRLTPAAIRDNRATLVLSGDFVRTLKAGETA